MALPLTKCWKYRNSVVKWQRWKYLNFKSDFKNSLTPLCQSPVDATSGYIFAKAIPILSYHKSRTIFSLVAIHIHTGKPYICEYTVWTPVYIWKILKMLLYRTWNMFLFNGNYFFDWIKGVTWKKGLSFIVLLNIKHSLSLYVIHSC